MPRHRRFCSPRTIAAKQQHSRRIKFGIYFISPNFFFLSPPIATQYGVGYAYCPMGNTATQLAPIAAQYGARIAIAMYKRHECKYINTRFHSLSSRNPLMGFIWNRASFTPGVAGGYSPSNNKVWLSDRSLCRSSFGAIVSGMVAIEKKPCVCAQGRLRPST